MSDRTISLRRLISQTGWNGVWIAALIVVVSVSGTYPIKLIEKIVNLAVDSTNGANLTPFLVYGALYVGVFVVWSGARYLLNTTHRRVEATVGHDLRLQVFAHTLRLRPEFFAEHQTGDVAADVLKDSEITTSQFLEPVLYVAQSVTKFGIGLILMLSIDWRMTLFVFPIGVFSAFLARRTSARVRAHAQEVRDSTTGMWGLFSEAIRGVREIQANLAINSMCRRLSRHSERAAGASVRQTRFNEAADAINSLFFMSAIGLIMTFGAILVARGGLSVGGLAAFMMYNSLLTDPAMDFVDFYRELQRTGVSIDRLNGFLHQPAYEDTDDVSRPHLTPAISLRNINFRYGNGDPALFDVSLDIQAGEHLAIVGRSGCGKTTLSHLIAGIRSPSAGTVTIGGREVDEQSLNLVRANLTIVFQDPFLFNSSIRENIRLGNPAARDEEIERAAGLACLRPVIDQARDGMNALIGENGVNLSGGERQRVGLAKAFLRRTPIYLLDEATSALDSSTSREVLDNLFSEFRESTIIVIAHKLASVQNMPRIVVIRNGRIVADGSHEGLMAECPDYSRLYQDQFSASQA